MWHLPGGLRAGFFRPVRIRRDAATLLTMTGGLFWGAPACGGSRKRPPGTRRVEDGKARRSSGGPRERAGKTRPLAPLGIEGPVPQQPRDDAVHVDRLAGAGAAPPRAEVVVEDRLADLRQTPREVRRHGPPLV